MDEYEDDDGLLYNYIRPDIENHAVAENDLNLHAMQYDFRQEIQLQDIKLENSLADAIFSAQQNKTPLILYVYNTEDKFFNCVRGIFKNKNVNDLFKYFTIFIWDIFDENTNRNLEEYVKVQNTLSSVQSKVKKRCTSLFVFMTVENFTLNATFEGSFKGEEFVNHLYNLQRLHEEKLLEKYAKVEMECIESAVRNFENQFGKDHVSFAKNHVEESLDNVLNAEPSYLRKNVVLWFYNKNNPWCKQFGHFLLKNDPLRKILDNFYVITWDIGNSSNIETLKTIIKNIFKLKHNTTNVIDMYVTIDCKENALFVFGNDESNQVSVKHCVYGKINKNDLIVKLVEIQSELEHKYEITSPAELQAIELFLRNNNNTALNPLYCNARPLSETIPEKCLSQSIQERKMLLMLFSNKNDKLHKNFFNAVTKKGQVIQENFIVIPWEISESVPYENLNLAIRRHFDLEKMEELLKLKRSGIYVFMPIANSLSLFSFMEKCSSSTISEKLDECLLFFTTEKKIEMKLADANANGVGAVHFQQAICDQLGNRDYDSFNLDKKLTDSDKTEAQLLKDKISFAFYGPPNEDNSDEASDKEKIKREKDNSDEASDKEKIKHEKDDSDEASNKEKIKREEDEAYNKEKIKREKKITSIYEQILAQVKKCSANPREIVISFIYNCLIPLPKERLAKFENDPEYIPNLDFTPVPVFVIRKCVRSPSKSPCRIFIDHDERVYTSWNNYLDNNKLPNCLFLVPKDGKYQGDIWGNVRLECRVSPMCGIGSTVLSIVDIGSAAVGIGAGLIGMASLTALPIAPIVLTGATFVGVGVGLYSMIRSSMTIHDRMCHDQDMSVFNSQARGAYMNIVAGSLGFTGSGAACALSYFASNGVKIGMITKGAVDGLTGINILVGGAAVANSTYEVMYQWYDTKERPDTLTIIQLSSSILFFGHAVCNTRSADSIVNEAQMQSLKEIQASLRSNRHRKTFNKLTKETIRVTGDGQHANAEVISYIKNLNNRDEVLALLTRSNKNLNKNGIRYMVNNGELNFNGIKVSVSEFTNLSNIQRNEYMLNLPPMMKTTATQRQKLQNFIETQLTAINVIRFGNIAVSLIQNPSMSNLCFNILNLFSPYISEKLLLLAGKTLEALNLNICLQRSFSQLFPGGEMLVRVLEMIKSFLITLAAKKELNYVTNKDTENFFNRKNVHRIIYFLEGTILALTMTLERAIRQILIYAEIWIANQLVKACENNEPPVLEVPEDNREIKCTLCGGFSLK